MKRRRKKRKLNQRKPGKGRPKGTPSDTGDDLTGRKRRELNRLKTDMVGAEIYISRRAKWGTRKAGCRGEPVGENDNVLP